MREVKIDVCKRGRKVARWVTKLEIGDMEREPNCDGDCKRSLLNVMFSLEFKACIYR